MTSAIDATKPVFGNPTTQSVRDNFSAAYDEITDLQSRTSGAPFLPITGGTMNGMIALQTDPTNPLEVATKRYVDNLAFGTFGGIPEAPVDGMMYARGQVAGGPAWNKTPLFQTVKVGPDSATPRIQIDTDAANNFIKFANATSDYLRFNRSTSTFELVANNTVVQSWTAAGTVINNLTVAGSSPTLHLNSSALANEYIYLETNGLKRWAIGADVSASGFGIFNYDASGNVLGKTLSIDKTTGAVSLVAARTPAGLIVDQKGNVGVGYVPPANAIQAGANGGWLFGWGMTAENWASHVYYDGTTWRHLDTSAGWANQLLAGGVSWQYTAAGVADAAATLATIMTLAPAGRLTISATSGSDPLYITVPSGNYSRLLTAVVGGRTWSAGVDPSGNYIISDESVAAQRFKIDLNGNATLSAGSMTVPYMRATNSIMNDTGTFYVANNQNYYLARSGGDGSWRFVEGGTTNFTVVNNGDCVARSSIAASSSLFAGGAVYARNQSMWFGGGGSGAAFQFASNYWFDWNESNGTLAWMSGGNAEWVMSNNGFCYNNWSNVGGHGGYADLSDARVKKDVTHAVAGLNEILALRPIKFTRIPNVSDKEFDPEIGFSAEQVRGVIPEAVIKFGAILPDGTGGIDSDYPTLGVMTTPIVAAMVNAFKTLHTRIIALERKLT